jgi:hypothetical protein
MNFKTNENLDLLHLLYNMNCIHRYIPTEKDFDYINLSGSKKLEKDFIGCNINVFLSCHFIFFYIWQYSIFWLRDNILVKYELLHLFCLKAFFLETFWDSQKDNKSALFFSWYHRLLDVNSFSDISFSLLYCIIKD